MSGFDGSWLDLREPADARARDPRLLAEAAQLAGARGGLVVDLGAGTGSTFRVLQPRLAEATRWRFVDADPVLLDQARRRSGDAVETLAADIADFDPALVDAAGLVTASALLDLVSASFVERLADALAERRLPFYAALSVDGRVGWSVPHPLDADVVSAFAAHQGGDKGFGAALGPAAPRLCAEAFRRRGFAVRLADSAWRLGPVDAALQDAFLGGFAAAVGETGRISPGDLADWAAFRRSAAASGAVCTVGHVDLLAVPAAR
ncbi:class I SAM-dependent methyltransferase [Antarcticirhabdus aurantiaca]|uniref:Class I SAM-dependent methyltransferase n=1 Tax=Antarcticirhabdus aurantiaca TaxID=2606717 RepID=A0ACD4NHA4_9HYPH|nr:class I SAM-dependent methyltransferase [Antarcticirhabdus aurantiaca]WAJ26167.1 class I SAM-dependent methyltransferase [Jeongeuplla avenae]